MADNFPNFDLGAPSTPKRNLSGWFLTLSLAAAIIALQLFSYMNRDPKGDAQVENLETTLKMVAFQSQIMEMSSKVSGTKITAAQRAQMLAPLEELVAEVAPARKKDVRAARLYAVIRTEQGKPVEPEDVQILAKSDSKIQRLFAEIYTSDKLTPERATQLAEAMPKTRYVYKMAAMQAREKAGDTKARTELFSTNMALALVIIGVVGVGLGTLSGILWIVYFIMRRNGALKPAGFPIQSVTPELGDNLALRSGLIFVAFIGLDVLSAVLLPGSPPIGLTSLIQSAVLALIVAHLATRSVWGTKLSLAKIGISPKNLGRNVLWGLGGAVANIPIFVGMALVGQTLFSNLPPAEHPITKEIAGGQLGPSVFIIFVLGAILAPIIEEIWFRGMLLPAVSRSLGGPLAGILAVSLLFAMIHPTGVPAWAALAAIGAMAAMLTYQTGSLVPAIVMHAAHNGALLAISMVILQR